MENGTYFYLMLFENMGYIRYTFFCMGFILYCAIVFFNALIILAIFLERTLHQPMYILISCLSVNSVFGTAAFFPRLLTDLLSDTHSVSRAACILQAIVIYSYASNENTILMLMAFDRYVAISKPLQYNNIMTPRILSVLISISWIYSILCVGIAGILNARLTMCGNKLWKQIVFSSSMYQRLTSSSGSLLKRLLSTRSSFQDSGQGSLLSSMQRKISLSCGEEICAPLCQ
uniref:Odorant receptor, family 64, subfamily D, member 1 n=1 Tax=Cyprinus carpio carpio TaxID=630221 RepID=A0A9J7Y479_CYPCA